MCLVNCFGKVSGTKDATNDASLAFATDAPLAAPRGGKRSARGPLSHRSHPRDTYIEMETLR